MTTNKQGVEVEQEFGFVATCACGGTIGFSFDDGYDNENREWVGEMALRGYTIQRVPSPYKPPIAWGHLEVCPLKTPD